MIIISSYPINPNVMFGKNVVCENGSISKKINIIRLNDYMKNKTIEINVKLNSGKFNDTVYGNDLTHEYLKINADYRSWYYLFQAQIVLKFISRLKLLL